MHSTHLLQAWVKNVYSLCVEGVINGAQSYTAQLTSLARSIAMRVQPPIFTHTFNSFTPSMYSVNSSHFNLLSTHLYTLSTPPTIKKIKKK
jgi:hypothetical protein